MDTIFKTIFDYSPVGLLLINVDGKIVATNKKACDIFGFDITEIKDLSVEELIPKKFRKQHIQHRTDYLKKPYPRSMASGMDIRARRKNGDEFPVEIGLNPVSGINNTSIVVSIIDISQRDELDHNILLKKHYQQMLSTWPTIIYRTDITDNYRCTFISENSFRILGYTAQEILDTPDFWYKHLHPEDKQQTVTAFIDGVTNDKGDLEYRFCDAHGEYLWIHDSYRIIYDESKKTRDVFGSWTDVSKRKQLETERDLMEIDLRLAQKLESVGQLASGIAHEINTPIQFVGDSIYFLKDAFENMQTLLTDYQSIIKKFSDSPQYTELIKETHQSEEDADIIYLQEHVPKAIDRIFDGTDRVSTIVRAMKEFAHSDSVKKTPVDLNNALQTTLIIARNEYKYVADVKTELGNIPSVYCHLGEINQVFLNMIVNAAHAITEAVGNSGKRGQINISSYCEGDYVVITFKDTGTGIPLSVQNRIFDPFFTTKEVGNGSGQGLSICRATIVDKHAGDITFKTIEGEGTTFFIQLPINITSESQEVIV